MLHFFKQWFHSSWKQQDPIKNIIFYYHGHGAESYPLKHFSEQQTLAANHILFKLRRTHNYKNSGLNYIININYLNNLLQSYCTHCQVMYGNKLKWMICLINHVMVLWECARLIGKGVAARFGQIKLSSHFTQNSGFLSGSIGVGCTLKMFCTLSQSLDRVWVFQACCALAPGKRSYFIIIHCFMTR